MLKDIADRLEEAMTELREGAGDMYLGDIIHTLNSSAKALTEYESSQGVEEECDNDDIEGTE